MYVYREQRDDIKLVKFLARTVADLRAIYIGIT